MSENATCEICLEKISSATIRPSDRVECQACWNNGHSKGAKRKTSRTVHQLHDLEKQNGGQYGSRVRRHERQHLGLESDKVDPQLDVIELLTRAVVGKF